MASRQSQTFRLSPRGAIFLSVGLAVAITARLQAQQSPVKTRTAEPAGEQKEQAASLDRYGDALPPGAKARLGMLWLQRDRGAQRACFGLSPDGKTIVTFSHGRWLKWWDANTGKLREQRELPVKFFFDPCLSSDGRLLEGTGAVEGKIMMLDIWDIRAGKPLQRLRRPRLLAIHEKGFSPDGKMFATATGFGNIIDLWDIASGKRRELRGNAFAFSPDSKRLASLDGRRVLLWDASTGEPIWQQETQIHEHAKVAFTFTPDGRTLIAAPHFVEHAWHAWDVATGKAAEGLKLPDKNQAGDLAVAPDGRTLLFVHHRNVYVAPPGYRHIHLWDLRAGKFLCTLPGSGDIGPFFPDGKSFLSNDGALQRWELATGRPLFAESYTLGHQARVFQVIYSPDGRRLASADDEGMVRLWDVATSKTLHVLRGHGRHFSMAFTPDGKFLITGAIEGKLHIWDAENGKLVRRILLRDLRDKDKDRPVWRLQVTPDGRTLLVLEYNPRWTDWEGSGVLSRWNLATGERKARAEIKGNLSASVFSSDGQMLVAGKELLDTATLKRRALLEEKRESTFGGCYALSADGRMAAGLIVRQRQKEDKEERMHTITTLEGYQTWETATGRTQRRILLGNQGEYQLSSRAYDEDMPLALSPDGRYLAAVDPQGLRVWDLTSAGKVVLKRPVTESMRDNAHGDRFACCLCFAPDGRTLATGNVDSTILIWDLPQAQQPPAKTQTKEPARKSEKQAAPLDRYGDALPPGAKARLGTGGLRGSSNLGGTRFGLTPDGKTIVTFSDGRRVKIWDADTGKLREQRELPVKLPFDGCLSADGRLLAGRERDYDTPLDFWDVRAGKSVQRILLPKRFSIHSPVFSPDGKMLAAENLRNVIYLWDIASGRRRDLTGNIFVFSPDGKRLASADKNRVVCWNTSTGEPIWQQEIGIFDDMWITLSFSPDGRTLIAAPHHDKDSWHVWDAATGQAVEGLKLPHKSRVRDLAVAPDGRTLVFVAFGEVGTLRVDRRIRIWDLRAGKLLHTLSTEGVIGPFFPDGKSFLSNDGALQRWELASGRPMFAESSEFGRRDRVIQMVYSPDGRRLASADFDGTIRLWDVAQSKTLHSLRGHRRYYFSMAFTPDGKFLITGAIEGELHIWDVETGKSVRRIPLRGPEDKVKDVHVRRLQVTADGRSLLVLEYDPQRQPAVLSRWNLATGERKAQDEFNADLTASVFSPDGKLLAAGLELLDAASLKSRVLLEENPLTKLGGCYAFSADGRTAAGLITGLTKGDDAPTRHTTVVGLQIWETATGKTRRCIPLDNLGQFRFTKITFNGNVPLALSPDGGYVAASDAQGLWVWEVATGKVVLQRPVPTLMSERAAGEPFASCLNFAPDGRTLATGNVDSTILIWDLPQIERPPAKTRTKAPAPKSEK